jgi:rhamnosyltransferase
MPPKVSIIIRAKNEERWIGHCLSAVFNQTYRDFEVIFVDNKSTDKTVDKASQFPIEHVITVDDFLPGKAINMGVEMSKGKYIANLSAHCVPTTVNWLDDLVRNLDEDEEEIIAGVYGRQEPLEFTHDLDKRDLFITFGLDKRVLIKDTFYHNANSLTRRSVLDLIPFSDTVTNIEDIVWAREVINEGYRIIYEPEASVYHHHGIHQSGDTKRAKNIINIIESITKNGNNSVNKLNNSIVAIIPTKDEPINFCGRPLIEYTLKSAQHSKYVKEIIVSTDNEEMKNISQKSGAQVPFLRPQELSAPDVGILDVLKYSLEQLENIKIFPDIIAYLSISSPFRPANLIDDMIELLLKRDFDTVIAGFPFYKPCWTQRNGEMVRIDQGFSPRAIKEPMHIGYAGLACITYPEFIRMGQMMGKNIGILEIVDSYSTIELKTPADTELAAKVFPDWWKEHGISEKK